MKTVGELMTRDQAQNLAIADERLRPHRIRHLPVVRQDGCLPVTGEDGAPMGILTEYE